MKKIMLTFVAAMFFVIGATAYAIDRRETGFVNVDKFDEIYVEANTRLKVITADTFSIRIDCPNSYEKRCLKYNITDGVLNIKSDYAYNNDERTKMFITVTTPRTDYKIVAGDTYRLRFRKWLESK